MNHGTNSEPITNREIQASIRRDLMKAIGDLLDSAAERHQTQELETAVYAVQRISMKLNHRSELTGLPGLSGLDPEDF